MATQYPFDDEDFLASVKRLGLVDEEPARHAVNATLRALGECLPPPERDALPKNLRAALAPYRGPAELDQFFERVRVHEITSSGFAREHTEIVCRVLGEMLACELVVRLRHALAPSVAALFEPSPAPGEPSGYRISESGTHHTLATGAPGSHKPISDSRPPGAQTESVVATDNPHGDRKLSGATGLTQEQTDESLATEVARSERTIAEGHD